MVSGSLVGPTLALALVLAGCGQRELASDDAKAQALAAHRPEWRRQESLEEFLAARSAALVEVSRTTRIPCFRPPMVAC